MPRLSSARPLSVRAACALLVGRLVAAVLRHLGRGATTLPGRAALAIDPDLPGRLAARLPQGVLLVTGTNGKTTTAAMLAAVLARRGWRVVHNRGGANLRSGITAALLPAGPRRAGPPPEVALLEVDEATMPFAGRALHPRLALVTNFFRDQLDRYGELTAAVARVRRGLGAMPEGAVAVLNADDPLVATLAEGIGQSHLRLCFFGVEPEALPEGEAGGGPGDVTRCPRCGAPLEYGRRYYAHVGVYRCGGCGLGRPRPDVAVVGWLPPQAGRPGELTLRTPAGALTFPLRLPGLYNAYNAAGAAAAALVLRAEPADVAAALGGFRGTFARMEWLELHGHPTCMALVKNPVGCSTVLRAVMDDATPGKALVLLLNDRTADGTDVSWIWDAEFELVAAAQADLAAVVAGGTRALDMALRLKYAGVDVARLRVVPEPGAAMAEGARAAAPGAPVYVLPTYTAMLAARAALARQGRVQPFWDT